MWRIVGIAYEKFPVLKSEERRPMDRMSFAFSTFSLTLGWDKAPI
jgi:hypothetical protein